MDWGLSLSKSWLGGMWMCMYSSIDWCDPIDICRYQVLLECTSDLYLCCYIHLSPPTNTTMIDRPTDTYLRHMDRYILIIRITMFDRRGTDYQQIWAINNNGVESNFISGLPCSVAWQFIRVPRQPASLLYMYRVFAGSRVTNLLGINRRDTSHNTALSNTVPPLE